MANNRYHRNILTLFHDESCRECRDVYEMLKLLGIQMMTRIPCSGMWQAKMSMGVATIEGIERIRELILDGTVQKWLNEDPVPKPKTPEERIREVENLKTRKELQDMFDLGKKHGESGKPRAWHDGIYVEGYQIGYRKFRETESNVYPGH